jgi:general secretion pathway protein K
MTPDRLQGVLDGRASGSASIRAPGAPPSPPQANAAQKTLRVAASIRFDNGRRVQAEAVILLIQDDEEPYHILSWHDDFDGPG